MDHACFVICYYLHSLLHLGSADSSSLTDAYLINGQLTLSTSSKNLCVFHHKFEEGRWYHICWTHTRHLFSTSLVNLYVNGKEVQSERLAYIVATQQNVRAYIGTQSAYKHRCDMQWKLASAIFLEAVLDEFQVCRRLVVGCGCHMLFNYLKSYCHHRFWRYLAGGRVWPPWFIPARRVEDSSM